MGTSLRQRVRLLVLGLVLGAILGAGTGVLAQVGPFTAQIQLLLNSANSWAGLQTFPGGITVTGTCTGCGGGGGTPGGAVSSIQFNNAGAFGGFGTWDGSLLAVTGGYTFTGNSAMGTGTVNQQILQTGTTFDATQFLNIRGTSTTAAVGGVPFYGLGLYVQQVVDPTLAKNGTTAYAAIQSLQTVVGAIEVDHVRAGRFMSSMDDATAIADDLHGVVGIAELGLGTINQYVTGGAFSGYGNGPYVPVYVGAADIANSAAWLLTSGLNGDAPAHYGVGVLSVFGGVHIPTITNDGGGSITTIYGLKVEAQTAGGTNYAIHTAAGLLSFNGNLLTLAGNFTTSGANALTLTTIGATNVTLPTTGTLATLAGAEALSGKTSITSAAYATATNCADSAGAAACGSAAAGAVVVDAAATSVVVSTTAVTANSQILILPDVSLGTRLSVTCNTTVPIDLRVTARTAGASFTATVTAPVTNPLCLNYWVVN